MEPTKAELEDAIQRLAKAKDRRESVISRVHKKVDGRNDQAELEAASDNLKDVFAKYVTAVASECVDQTAVARRKMDELAQTVLKDPKQPQLGFAEGVDPKLIDEYKRAKESRNDIEMGNALMIVQEMAAARYRVDQAQLDIKANKKGGKWIGKFRTWWTKHPAMRAGIGAGLAVVGAVGTATGAAPLALGAFAARRAIGATGTYMGIEGAGRFVTNKRSERADKLAAKNGLEGLAAEPGGEAVRSSAEGLAKTGSEFKAGTAEQLPEQERVFVEQFIQENFRDILTAPDGLMALLRGAEADPVAVTGKLLDRRLDQLKSDVTWTRRSKYLAAVGAAAFSAYSLNQIRNVMSGPGGGQPSPEAPAGGTAPSGDELNKAFMSGMENRMGPDQYQSSWKALQAAGDPYSNKIFASNPVNAEWVETVRSLPAENQLRAARFLGDSMVKEPLSQATLDAAKSYFG